MKNQTIPVFSLVVARNLLSKGFRIFDINNNRDYSDRLVFFFHEEGNIKQVLKSEHGIHIK